ALSFFSLRAQVPPARGFAAPEPSSAHSPAVSGFSVENMDLRANPCVDFYQYACGTWIANNPVPPDQSRWDRFDALTERNRIILRNILEKSSADDPRRDANTQKIGDFYSSCMDEQAIEKRGLKAIQPELDAIAGLRDKNALARLIAGLHRKGVNIFFSFDS